MPHAPASPFGLSSPTRRHEIAAKVDGGVAASPERGSRHACMPEISRKKGLSEPRRYIIYGGCNRGSGEDSMGNAPHDAPLAGCSYAFHSGNGRGPERRAKLHSPQVVRHSTSRPAVVRDLVGDDLSGERFSAASPAKKPIRRLLTKRSRSSAGMRLRWAVVCIARSGRYTEADELQRDIGGGQRSGRSRSRRDKSRSRGADPYASFFP